VTFRVFLALGAIALVAVCFPESAHAWTPGTHVYLGESLLANLHLLPAATAELLRAFPFDFLYGNIAADSSIAKKYAPVGRHCHYWHVGQEIHDAARGDSLRAFGLGYLCHLAADTVAHNYFVPRQLVLTASTAAVGHAYWENRVDTHLGAAYARAAKELILMDTSQADEHLAQIISPTLFSVGTNRRLFKGLVHLAETRGFQSGLKAAVGRSRWSLTDVVVEQHLGLSYDYMIDLLSGVTPVPRRLDPSGEQPLHVAKTVRRQVLQAGGRTRPSRLLDAAEEHFGLPGAQLTFWPERIRPLPWRAPAPARERKQRRAEA
jgi:hypothetical protein